MEGVLYVCRQAVSAPSKKEKDLIEAIKTLIHELREHAGGSLVQLPRGEAEIFWEAKRILEGFDVTLIDAARCYVQLHKGGYGARSWCMKLANDA